MTIHPSAVIDPGAELGPEVEVGPFCTIGPDVRLERGVVLRPHVHLAGHTTIGAETQIFSFASVGEFPQDKKYKGEPTRLVIGERNVIREYVTMHPGTAGSAGLTTVGDDNLFMIGVHVGHDCQIGSDGTFSNGAQLAGHVIVEDYAVLSGNCGTVQFVRIGESAMVGAMAGVNQDIAPFSICTGSPARLFRANKINMERRGFSKEKIEMVERAYRIIFRSGLLARDAFAQVREELSESPEAERMVAFLEKSERGFARHR